ncbi:MAG: class I SAM-dependent methyltransferase [Candidatus Dormibacteria bacterium]
MPLPSEESVMNDGFLARAPQRDWAASFAQVFSGPASRVQARVWREVMGDEYPETLDTFSYTTNTELERCVRDLALEPGGLMADIGCGRGGPGLWVAGRSGARLIGLDIADPALEAARHRASNLGLGETSEFRLGSFEDTGLREAELDGVLSVDAFLFAPEKTAAAAELRRVLKPGARLVMTTWDYHRQPAGRPPQVPDHRPLLEAAGFTTLAYDDTPAWRERQTHIGQLLVDAVPELAAESGRPETEVRDGLEEMHATLDCMIRRVFIVAEAR